ncbi:phosphatase PAP2 family protein [Prevotella cerevisiae]|uniref:Phosphatase PAP2 family protein n=1 Tax=Segatella cerevisiae TaxID=2053716 RepID=A0ABT1BTG0_9BACT|nr:phosphatase PAP2 family protein [Segatella cerevisiae]MCO6024369.1 phosphatase PAP2 family protein [Segatella cerevisiae]
MLSIYLIIVYIALVIWKKSRKLALYFLPWAIFGVSYDMMRLCPNYKVSPIDVGHLYDLEKSFFGIAASGMEEIHKAAEVCKGSAEAIYDSGVLIPGEYFAIHHTACLDFLSGLFYLCWVPVPLAFAFYLFFRKQYQWCLKFSWSFLFVNVLGFIIYYIHPATPPWYVMNYGFHAFLNTPGNVGGLGRWDTLTGLPLFHLIYGENANVFAAVPSLHAAYMLITTYYAIRSHKPWYTVTLFAIICMGIWFTAVYAGHHYIIDVILGILTAIVGLLITELGIYRIPPLRRFLQSRSK